MSKLERLLNLTALLLETVRPLTIEEIGRSVPGYPEDPASFRRAFERDKDDIRELGIPLRLVQLSATDATHLGYTIEPDDYYLTDPGLEPDELAALWLAAGAVRLEGSTNDSAFRKLGGVPTVDSAEPTALAGLAEVSVAPHLDAVFGAIVERRSMTFTYRGETRRVEPHHLGFERSRWYLVAFDRDRAARRVFRLDRFDDAPVLGDPGDIEPSSAPVSLRIEPWRYGDGEAVDVVVEVDDAEFRGLVGRVGEESVVSPANDSAGVVRIEVRDRAAFRHFILGFGAGVRVVEPPEIVEDITSWLREAAR